MGPRPGSSGLCPERNWSPQRRGGGHTSIASHGYYRCSNASYGGRCPVGQRPNSTKVEGRHLPDSWCLPRPWKFPGPHRGAGESRGWPNSWEGGLGHARDTRILGSGRARGAEGAGQGRPHFHFHGGIPKYGSWVRWLAPGGSRGPGGPSDPRAESFSVTGCRSASLGWLRWPVKAIETETEDTSPILSDP